GLATHNQGLCGKNVTYANKTHYTTAILSTAKTQCHSLFEVEEAEAVCVFPISPPIKMDAHKSIL
ncbi:TPA: hypothetical protein ACPZS7_004187, partial [Yersinia enterocolitica]